MMKQKIGLTARIVIIATLMMSFPGTVFADGGDGGYSATANGFQITLAFAEPAETGANEFHIQISDTIGMPVSNAEVEVTAMPVEAMSDHEEGPAEEMHDMEMATEAPAVNEMDGMAGMEMSPNEPSNEMESNSHDDNSEESHAEESMQVSLVAGHEPGEYSGEIMLDTSGTWIFSIHFTVDGQMTEVEIPVEVVGTVSKPGILAGFFGLNATLIATAAVMKRKSISK
jgi:hypothetical protein